MLKKCIANTTGYVIKTISFKKKLFMRSVISLALVCIAISVYSQADRKITRAEYIDLYKDLAMDEMKRTGIPASITLAQGILESGDGNSRLATKANNHFGIKCHNWDGPSVNHDDDKKDECFRKYKSAEHSYRDHSDFLTSRSRYASLFDLKPDDYKAWAKGLREAGYATSPTYAKALIKVIDENQLYKYDEMVLSSTHEKGKNKPEKNHGLLAGGRKVLYNNRVKYIVADSNDTYEKIAGQLHLMSWQLPRYNDVSVNPRLQRGDFVYLQPKRNRAAVSNKIHIVKEGEDMHSISQLYGVKEQKLRERNKIPNNSEPNVGVAILLRGKVKDDIQPSQVKIKPEKEKTIDKPVKESNSEETNDSEESEFIIEYDLGD